MEMSLTWIKNQDKIQAIMTLSLFPSEDLLQFIQNIKHECITYTKIYLKLIGQIKGKIFYNKITKLKHT